MRLLTFYLLLACTASFAGHAEPEFDQIENLNGVSIAKRVEMEFLNAIREVIVTDTFEMNPGIPDVSFKKAEE